VAFVWFLLAGPPGWVELGFAKPVVLSVDAGLCLAFFAQHSGMVRRSFRLRLARVAPPEWHGALYAIAAGIVLLTLVLFWQDSGPALDPPPTVVWFLRAAGLASLGGIVWALRALPSLDPFGIGPIVHRQRGTEPRPQRVTVRGPYRWVRHPMYSFALVLIWSYPYLTADRLLFNLLWTTWVWVGTVLEERDLVDAFGDAYRQYQRSVPMLIPHRIPRGIYSAHSN
jgi:protein-S-isoprenylcysteine O-methyltransferase Ste14